MTLNPYIEFIGRSVFALKSGLINSDYLALSVKDKVLIYDAVEFLRNRTYGFKLTVKEDSDLIQVYINKETNNEN